MSGVGSLYLSVSEWHVWGDNLFCDPNLCVERLQTALQPSHPISQLITVRTIYCARVCVCVWVVCDWGSEYDERNVLSILSRGDVLKGTLLLINSWDPKEKGTFCGFAEIKRRKKNLLLVSILTDAACARSYVLDERHIISGQLSYLLFTALWETLVARSTAVTYNISRSNGILFMCRRKP